MYIVIASIMAASCHDGNELTWDCQNQSSRMIYRSASGIEYIITPNQKGWITLNVSGDTLGPEWDTENMLEHRGDHYIINDAILISNQLYRNGYDSNDNVRCKTVIQRESDKYSDDHEFTCYNRISDSTTNFYFDENRGIISMWNTADPEVDRMALKSRFGLGKPCSN